MNTLDGTLDASGLRFGLVVSQFNEFVTSRLQAAAVEVLTQAGAVTKQLTVVRVPGAFEIPLVARQMALSQQFDAVICLGAVIRGETPHFDFIAAEAARGIAQAGWDSGIPVIFGVLTTETVEQALERAGAGERNRGGDAARSAIQMATVMRALRTMPGSAGFRPKAAS
ncbi:MAG: 6,7-dimethyl-8-ribityllumazine synthase [Nitrospiraceae bacterium]